MDRFTAMTKQASLCKLYSATRAVK